MTAPILPSAQPVLQQYLGRIGAQATGPKLYGPNAGHTATSGTLGTSGYRQRSRNLAARQAINQRLAALGTTPTTLGGI